MSGKRLQDIILSGAAAQKDKWNPVLYKRIREKKLIRFREKSACFPSPIEEPFLSQGISDL